MICKKCHKDKSDDCFPVDHGYLTHVCKACRYQKRKRTDWWTNEKKEHPDRFCRVCGVRFNGILKKKQSEIKPKLCEDCAKT